MLGALIWLAAGCVWIVHKDRQRTTQQISLEAAHTYQATRTFVELAMNGDDHATRVALIVQKVAFRRLVNTFPKELRDQMRNEGPLLTDQ